MQACLNRIALDPEMFAHLDDVFRQARMKRFPDRTHRRAAQGFRFRGRIDLLAGPPGLSFQRLSAKGRRPALKQGRIAGSDSPKPLFFSGVTAIELFLPEGQHADRHDCIRG